MMLPSGIFEASLEKAERCTLETGLQKLNLMFTAFRSSAKKSKVQFRCFFPYLT